MGEGSIGRGVGSDGSARSAGSAGSAPATWRGEPRLRSIAGASSRRLELVGLAVILVVGALVRFVDLPSRGTWDADQGTDMLVLWRIAHEGAWPLLGPPTSIGDFHHGVLYYLLLAPVGILSGADPIAVVAVIAAAGVAAVAVVWWLARAIGGPAAGLVAAGLMAISASAIEESTFIWNPNLIALSSAVSLAAAWRAWTGGRAAWWTVAAAAQAVTMHCHVLGAVMLVPLGALWVAHVRRRPGSARGPLLRAGAAGLGLIALSYVPLLVHELQSGFGETRAALEFLAGGSGDAAAPLPVRLVVVPLRVLSWPLAGLVTSQPLAAIAAAAIVVAILAWRATSRGAGTTDERLAARWFAGTLAWSALALAVGASSLSSVIPGLPNDHYHAFLDPIVFVTVGLGAAALWRHAPVGPAVSRGLVVAGLAAFVGLNVLIWPPRESPDGGYPAAEAAAARILDRVPDAYTLQSLPGLKNPNTLGFPLAHLGRPPVESDAPVLVIACDRLLEPIIGAPCGGPAEDAAAAGRELEERFPASARTVVSIYR